MSINHNNHTIIEHFVGVSSRWFELLPSQLSSTQLLTINLPANSLCARYLNLQFKFRVIWSHKIFHYKWPPQISNCWQVKLHAKLTSPTSPSFIKRMRRKSFTWTVWKSMLTVVVDHTDMTGGLVTLWFRCGDIDRYDAQLHLLISYWSNKTDQAAAHLHS